jgi:ATP-dependent 26S proteasome regulatory subunit
MLREELQLLQESGSYVGEVVKAMDKKKVLVKVSIFVFYLVLKLFSGLIVSFAF